MTIIKPSSHSPSVPAADSSGPQRPHGHEEVSHLWRRVANLSRRHGLSSMEMDLLDELREELRFRAPSLAARFAPRTIDIEQEEARFSSLGMHVLQKHGPQLDVWTTSPDSPSLQARKEGHPHFGDQRADRAKPNYRWSSLSILNQVLNGHLTRNWPIIANDLALHGHHSAWVRPREHRLGMIATGLVWDRDRWVETQTDRAHVYVKAVTVPTLGWFVHSAYPEHQRTRRHADSLERR